MQFKYIIHRIKFWWKNCSVMRIVASLSRRLMIFFRYGDFFVADVIPLRFTRSWIVEFDYGLCISENVVTRINFYSYFYIGIFNISELFNSYTFLNSHEVFLGIYMHSFCLYLGIIILMNNTYNFKLHSFILWKNFT